MRIRLELWIFYQQYIFGSVYFFMNQSLRCVLISNRHLRLAELLRLHSSESEMIVMTLPLPRRGQTSPALYMAWLDIMTRNLPTILLTRGNQEPVLTFYSQKNSMKKKLKLRISNNDCKMETYNVSNFIFLFMYGAWNQNK